MFIRPAGRHTYMHEINILLMTHSELWNIFQEWNDNPLLLVRDQLGISVHSVRFRAELLAVLGAQSEFCSVFPASRAWMRKGRKKPCLQLLSNVQKHTYPGLTACFMALSWIRMCVNMLYLIIRLISVMVHIEPRPLCGLTVSYPNTCIVG